MDRLQRFTDWWLGQFHGQRAFGKLVWAGAPLLFLCCGLTMCSVMLSPPTPEPTAEVADRAAAIDVPQQEPSEEPATETTELTNEPATATQRPTNTAAPTDTARPTSTEQPTNTPRPTATPTDEPTSPPIRAATAIAATVAATQPVVAPTNTAVPIVALPTATLAPPTAPPATAVPTELPQPTSPPVAAPGDVFISSIRYDGDVPRVESDEYAVITNRGAAVVNLSGWRLNAGEPDQNFTFPSFDLQPGQSCRVYTNEYHPETCGFSFGRGDAIWRNSGDCGYLYDASGAEVSRYCW